MDSAIVIQRIETHWSKESRGGPSAVLRNAVPESLTLPASLSTTSQQDMIEHWVSYSQWEGFDRPRVTITQEAPGKLKLGCVLIEPLVASVRVVFEYDPKYAGMPIRFAPSG